MVGGEQRSKGHGYRGGEGNCGGLALGESAGLHTRKRQHDAQLTRLRKQQPAFEACAGIEPPPLRKSRDDGGRDDNNQQREKNRMNQPGSSCKRNKHAKCGEKHRMKKVSEGAEQPAQESAS